jgi:hypothetical protein
MEIAGDIANPLSFNPNYTFFAETLGDESQQ